MNMSEEKKNVSSTSPSEEVVTPVPEEVAPKEKNYFHHFEYEGAEKLLEVSHLTQYFRFANVGPNKFLKAVNNVSFDVYRGEVFGLVGESGCGKTTTGRDIMKLYKITSGDVRLNGVRISAGTRHAENKIKRARQRIYQSKVDAKKELSELKKSFDEESKEKYGLVLNEKNISSEAEGSEKQTFFKDYQEKRKVITDRRDAIIEEANHDIEKAKGIIKSCRYDEANYVKAIIKEALERVDASHPDLVKKLSTSGVESLNEEEKKEYEVYLAEVKKAKHASLANKVQMIFQDPIASLNPRMTVRNIIAEGLIIQGGYSKDEIERKVEEVLVKVGLVPEHANRYPHEFSGGQRQRIGIARAIIMNPELIVADEPVSALDVSVQAQVINLLNDLRNELNLTIIFIAHNLSVVKYFCDRIAVMYYGNLVELASSEELFAHPLHPYTKSLLSAVPYPDPITESTRKRVAYNPAESHAYSVNKPSYREIAPGHFVYCNDEEEIAYKKELSLG